VHLLTTTRPSTGLDLLAGDPGAPALVTAVASLDVAELAERVDDRRAALGADRRLVLATVGNDVESVVTYLAALAGGHPVLLLPAGGTAGVVDPAVVAQRDRLVARYDPDVVVHGGAADVAGPGVAGSGVAGPGVAGPRIEERRDGSRHVFHPDLALLASTSGSTGSPKLVRISRDNLLSNARSIAEYLAIRPGDRAAATLPLHYCYGLSVLNSHLVAGASVLLTERSVVEPDFWSEFDAHRATSFAGVPYTFDLLESAGLADRLPPSLRTVTQAGGRLAPERVRDWARRGRAHGLLRRHVRPDRGDGTHGLPAARARRDGCRRDRPAHPGRVAPHRRRRPRRGRRG